MQIHECLEVISATSSVCLLSENTSICFVSFLLYLSSHGNENVFHSSACITAFFALADLKYVSCLKLLRTFPTSKLTGLSIRKEISFLASVTVP